MILRQQQFRRVAHLAEPVLLHFIDAQFGCRAEAVFHCTEDSVHIVLVSLKLNHGIHDVLQNLRTCKGAFLVDMADENHGDAARLGKAEQGRGAFTNLGDAAWRGIHILGGNRLNGVYDYNLRLHLFNIIEDILQRRFGQNQQIVL